jgi:hypothetical protein
MGLSVANPAASGGPVFVRVWKFIVTFDIHPFVIDVTVSWT